jgi:hypothetical protein
MAGVDDGSQVYFTHSYAAPVIGETAAVCEYGMPFSAAVERGNRVGVQFHPEKSGDVGLKILTNWLSGMLSKRIIACLDVRDGKVVKGVNFEGLRDAGDPAALAPAIQRRGHRRVVILDVTATIESRQARAHTIAAVARGIFLAARRRRRHSHRGRCAAAIEAGADKVSLNTRRSPIPA